MKVKRKADPMKAVEELRKEWVPRKEHVTPTTATPLDHWSDEPKRRETMSGFLCYKVTDSAVISRIDFNCANGNLWVQFKYRTGPSRWYRYSAVPTRVHEGFLQARSKGKYYSTQIKGKYACVLINQEGQSK